MRRYLLPFWVFLLILTFPFELSAKKPSVITDNVMMVFYQANKIYIKPFGKTDKYYVTKDPVSYAVILGLTLHRQKIYIDKGHYEYADKLDIVVKETDEYLKFLANAHNHKNPLNGKAMSEKMIRGQFYHALMGNMNEWVKKNKKIDPSNTRVAMILDRVKKKEPSNPKGGGFIAQKDDGRLNILGQEVSGPVKIKPLKLPDVEGEVPLIKKQICPDRPKVKNYPERIDINNNPNDEIYVLCSYHFNKKYRDTLTQSTMVNLKRHGIELEFNTYNYGQFKGIKYLKSLTTYKNGKYDGLYQGYNLDKRGNPWLEYERNYSNGKMTGREKIWHLDSSNRRYLSMVKEYLDGDYHGTNTSYRANGEVIKKWYYNHGKLIREGK